MKLIYPLLIQIIFLANLHCQNITTIYRENDSQRVKEEYSYNENNQQIEFITSTYFKQEKITARRTKTEWIYENNRVGFIKNYSYGTSGWRLSSEYQNTYDEDGCILNQNKNIFILPSGTRESTSTLVNEYDCSEPWKNNSDELFLDFFPVETRITRRRTDTSEIEIYEELDDFYLGEWIEKGIMERKYNQKNNLVEYLYKFPNFFTYADKYVYTYDTTGENIMSCERFIKDDFDGNWESYSLEEYFYENSLLQKVIRHTNSLDGAAYETLYEYYCDGLLKKITTIYAHASNNPWVETYEYDQKINDTGNCEELGEFDLNIFPNPANNVFFIESDIFQKESSEILVYDTSGKLMHRQEVKDRRQRVEVKVNSDMSLNNMLIVHLISEGGDRVSEKVFIGKLHR